METDSVAKPEPKKSSACPVCQAQENGSPITQAHAEMIPGLVARAKGGCLRSTQLLADYYDGLDCAEGLKWQIFLRKQASADPAQKIVDLDKLDRAIEGTKQKIKAYDLSKQSLQHMITASANGDVFLMDTIFHYHLEHHDFRQALYWLEKMREQMIAVAGSDEALGEVLDRNYDAIRDQVLDRAQAYQLLNK